MLHIVDRLLGLPIVLSFVFLTAAWILIAMGSVWLSSRLISPAASEDGKDSLYRLLAVVSSFYAFLVGFIIVQEWSNVSQAQGQVSQEAAALQTASLNTIGLPPPAAAEMRTAIVQYDRSIICTEFPTLSKKDSPSPLTTVALAHLLETGYSLPATVQDASSSAYGDMMRGINQAAVARRSRVNAATNRPPAALLFVFVATGLILIFVASLQYAKNRGVHLTTVIAIAVFIALGQGLVVNLSRPFAGAADISDAPLRVGVPAELLRCDGIKSTR